MDYKKYARSPECGKIYAYDKDGRIIEELDILETRLVDKHTGKEYTVRDLLKETVRLTSEVMIQDGKLEAHKRELAALHKGLSDATEHRNKMERALYVLADTLDADKI